MDETNHKNTERKNPKCPFYGFHWSDETKQLIPVNGSYCGLRRFLYLDHSCLMEYNLEGPNFRTCDIAKKVFKKSKNKEIVKDLEVLTISKSGKESPIVPFNLWIDHTVYGFDLEYLIK